MRATREGAVRCASASGDPATASDHEHALAASSAALAARSAEGLGAAWGACGTRFIKPWAFRSRASIYHTH